jgi:RHS repeat-associated protein
VARPVYDPASGELTSVAYCAATTVSAACSPAFAPYGGNGTTLAVERDSAGSVRRVTSTAADGTTMADDVVSRSRSGKVVDQSVDGADPNPLGANFAYDAAGRLTSAHVPGRSLTYGYAPSGGCGAEPAAGKNSNRTSMTDSTGPSATYCYDRMDQLTSVDPSLAIHYDGHGSTTVLGDQTLTWDSADRHTRTVVANGPTVNYGRDATGRITTRDEGTPATTTQYVFAGPGDSPVAVANSGGSVLQRLVPMPGGAFLTKQAAGDVWSYPNVHGDVVVTADASGTKRTTRAYDPFGQGEPPDNAQGEFDYGWLGQHQRPLEHAGSIATIEMGARPYVPSLGRFLSVDPVAGGNENDFTYPTDPVNAFDLNGTCGVFGNPFKPCKPPPGFDVGTFDNEGNPVLIASSEDPAPSVSPAVRVARSVANAVDRVARPLAVDIPAERGIDVNLCFYACVAYNTKYGPKFAGGNVSPGRTPVQVGFGVSLTTTVGGDPTSSHGGGVCLKVCVGIYIGPNGSGVVVGGGTPGAFVF